MFPYRMSSIFLFIFIHIITAMKAGFHSPALSSRMREAIKNHLLREESSKLLSESLNDVFLDIGCEDKKLLWDEYEKLSMEWSFENPSDYKDFAKFPSKYPIQSNLFGLLPNELMAIIFSHFRLEDLKWILLVCKQFNAVLCDRSFIHLFERKKREFLYSALYDDYFLFFLEKSVSFDQFTKSVVCLSQSIKKWTPSIVSSFISGPQRYLLSKIAHNGSGVLDSPYNLLCLGLFKDNEKCKEYAMSLVKKHFHRVVHDKSLKLSFSVHKHVNTKWKDQLIPIVLNRLADDLTGEQDITEQTILNFLTLCDMHIFGNAFEFNFNPLHPQIVLLITRLSIGEYHNQLRRIYNYWGANIRVNVAIALATGSFQLDTLPKVTKENLIQFLLGFPIHLDDPSHLRLLIIHCMHFYHDGHIFGSPFVIDFPPKNFMSLLMEILAERMTRYSYLCMPVTINELQGILDNSNESDEALLESVRVRFSKNPKKYIAEYTYDWLCSHDFISDLKKLELIILILKCLKEQMNENMRIAFDSFIHESYRKFPMLSETHLLIAPRLLGEL